MVASRCTSMSTYAKENSAVGEGRLCAPSSTTKEEVYIREID